MSGNGVLIYYLRGPISRLIYDVTESSFSPFLYFKKKCLRGEANIHLAASEFPAFCETLRFITIFASGFGGLVVSMLPSGTQDRGFATGRGRRIFYNLPWKSQIIG
jgi:hypothetical protein